MKAIKKADIDISGDEYINICYIEEGSKHNISVEDVDFKYLFEFEKYPKCFGVFITIIDKKNSFNVKYFFSGGVEVSSLFDKVFYFYFAENNTKLFLKLNTGINSKKIFVNSTHISKKIGSIGDINLYNHIIYTDFNDDMSIIELCFKYSCFCIKVLSKKSHSEIVKLLDKDLDVIVNLFQQKLEYYGYTSEEDIRKKTAKQIEIQLNKIPKTAKDRKNKIILLTQYLFYNIPISITVLTDIIESEVTQFS